MPTLSEKNQFRRYIGNYDQTPVSDAFIDAYLDDAARELSSSEGSMVTVIDFDVLNSTYKPEVIILAAINYWWNKAAEYLTKVNMTVGQASVEPGVRYDRAMQMIERLQELHSKVAVLGSEISVNHISRFSKQTLTRLGGQREEKFFEA